MRVVMGNCRKGKTRTEPYLRGVRRGESRKLLPILLITLMK